MVTLEYLKRECWKCQKGDMEREQKAQERRKYSQSKGRLEFTGWKSTHLKEDLIKNNQDQQHLVPVYKTSTMDRNNREFSFR